MVDIKEVNKLDVLVLEPGEYIILPEHRNGVDYEVFYKGTKLMDVTGVIRSAGFK